MHPRDVWRYARMTWSYDNYMAYARRVVHDVANPVNAISMHLELVELLLGGNAKGADVLERTRADLERTLATARRSMYLPDLPISSQRSPLGLHDCIIGAWSLVRAAGSHIECNVAPEIRVIGSDGLLQQALIQLLANAAAFGGGTVECAMHEGSLSISNQADMRFDKRWWEPGYTTQEGHQGIGLNIARGALEAMGARLSLESSDDGTCTAAVTLSVNG